MILNGHSRSSELRETKPVVASSIVHIRNGSEIGTNQTIIGRRDLRTLTSLVRCSRKRHAREPVAFSTQKETLHVRTPHYRCGPRGSHSISQPCSVPAARHRNRRCRKPLHEPTDAPRLVAVG